jgi:hypothetical protein
LEIAICDFARQLNPKLLPVLLKQDGSTTSDFELEILRSVEEPTHSRVKQFGRRCLITPHDQVLIYNRTTRLLERMNETDLEPKKTAPMPKKEDVPIIHFASPNAFDALREETSEDSKEC